MKRIIISIIILSGFFLAANAQNLMENGGLEVWSNPTTPQGWDKAEDVSQSDVNVHGGVYSAQHTSASSTKDMQQDVEGIVAGVNYEISYWYFDNDPQARTRIWSYWLSGGSTLPDHEDVLRPSVYSEDNPGWQHFSVTLTAPPTADAFRFEVRVYKQDNVSGGSVFYDDFSVEQAGVDPEPENYPTDFAAAATGVSIDLTWTDALGAQLPSAYLILASDQDNIQPPLDGTPVADDTDLSDGSGALNVPYGDEMCTFANLMGNEQYFFSIFPYTNGGANIDYKTDGTPPEANATTADITVIETENFNDSWGNWTRVSVTGSQEWERDNNYGLEGTPCARVSGYEGGSFANEDWLISPVMNFDDYENETLSFYTAMNYSGPELEVLISTDYDGGGSPGSATWDALSGTFSGGSWEWINSGDIDISGYSGNTVYVAFKYTSTESESATWEVDDILITGTELVGIPGMQGNIYKVEVLPNPATDFISIETGSMVYHEAEIFTVRGESKWLSMQGIDSQKISVAGWDPGMYVLRIKTAGGTIVTRKFIVR